MSDEHQMGQGNNRANDRIPAEKDIPPWLQPVPEEEMVAGFFSGRKVWIAAGVAVTVVVLFGATIWMLYDGAADEAPRHIVAETTPIREKPADPGGMDIPNQDKQVLDHEIGQTMTSQVSLAPQPEEPMENLPEEAMADDEGSEDPIGDLAAEATEKPEVKPEPAKAIPASKPAAKPATETAAKAKASAASASATAFMVQLGAYGSEDGAAKAWRVVKGKYGNFLAGLSPSYEPVEAGGRTLYRLRVGPLDNRAAADEVCLGLRAQQQACIVVNP